MQIISVSLSYVKLHFSHKHFMISKLYFLQINSGTFHSMVLGDCMTLQWYNAIILINCKQICFTFSINDWNCDFGNFLHNTNIQSMISFFFLKQQCAFPYYLKFALDYFLDSFPKKLLFLLKYGNDFLLTQYIFLQNICWSTLMTMLF